MLFLRCCFYISSLLRNFKNLFSLETYYQLTADNYELAIVIMAAA